jgi:hypothetical protein
MHEWGGVGQDSACLLPDLVACVEMELRVRKIDASLVKEGELSHGEGVTVEARMGSAAM